MKPSKALTINKHEAQLRVYWGCKVLQHKPRGLRQREMGGIGIVILCVANAYLIRTRCKRARVMGSNN